MNFEGSAGESDVSWLWHVVDDDVHLTGERADYTFSKTGPCEVHVARRALLRQQLDTASPEDLTEPVQTHHFAGTVHVRYIKRELRSMSDEDRDAFLGALETVRQKQRLITSHPSIHPSIHPSHSS